MEELIFDDISLVVIPVKIAGVNYNLTEANEEVASRYQNKLLACYKISSDGKNTEFRNGIADVQSELVSNCLTTEDGKKVSITFIKSLPSRIVKTLADKVKEISGLEKDDAEDSEKN